MTGDREAPAPPNARQRRPRRGPRKATPEYLRKAALHYLERYAGSAAHLRRLLLFKVARSAQAHGTDSAAGAAEVEALIAEFLRNGLLDDARYAEARARALHRRGASARAIRAALAVKGISRALTARALERLREEEAEPELAAALAYARRRRLGPYRSRATRADMRARDLATLGRQGFGYELARRVIDAGDPEELEREAGLAGASGE
ncbi:MAG: RecX family transcriptional regulator [Kiloniellaceae bacterium]